MNLQTFKAATMAEALTQVKSNMGSDAVILIYDAAAKKVFSINAEGTAPKLATIDWYKQHNDGKLPVNDTLLSATVQGADDG